MNKIDKMNRMLLYISLILISLSSCNTSSTSSYVDYVNPFIGSEGFGHTSPNACYPLGLIQVGPESGYGAWDYCAGYQYADTLLNGFTHTRLNGTGCQGLGDILILPFTGSDKGGDLKGRKANEAAEPGYYEVEFTNFGVHSMMTASPHVGMHKFNYPESIEKKLLIDFQAAIVRFPKDMFAKNYIENDSTIVGHTIRKGWTEREFFYVVKFSQPFITKKELPKNNANAEAPRVILNFGKNADNLVVKVALSTKSIEGAKQNLETEIPDWDFEKVRVAASDKWEELLSRVQIEGTLSQKHIFYTSLYRLFIQPNNLADVNETPNYSTFSLWDTYRAAHPLYTIVSPEYVDGFINSMLVHYEKNGVLPIWALWGNETHTMIGNHSVPVIADAYLKGFRGFDTQKAYRYIKSSLTEEHEDGEWSIYDQYGYLPYDLIKTESVSKTLEYGYDDYCAAQMARNLGYEEDYNFFSERAAYYKNLFDPNLKLMRPKDSDGNWLSPFDRFAISHASTHGGAYTEGNAWQYTWHVQHDIKGLISLMGGEEYFTTKLDSLFEFAPTRKGEGDGFINDVTGLIGQYAHGNEPSHHIPYLYALAGKPWRTQEIVHQIINEKYQDTTDGLSGNDDCGQMSAWLIFSSMGFYPVNPCGGEYVLGAPQIPKAIIQLPENKAFTITTESYSKKNIYVQEILLNGRKYTKRTINHNDIINGGELLFVMTDTPKDQ